MFRNRVITFTTAVLFGASSLAMAQPTTPGSQQQGQQQPSSQSRPQTQTQSQGQASASQSATANLQSPVRGTLVSVDTDEKTLIITLDQSQSGAASGSAGTSAARPGATSSGATGSAQSGSAQSGSAQSGSAQSGSAQSGSAQAGSSQSGSQAGAASAQAGAARPSGAMAAAQVEFNYDDNTQVTGAERGIAGLAAMKASRVTVHFVRENNQLKATRIEVQPAGAASPSSSSSPGSSSTPGSSTPGSSTPGSSTPGSSSQPRPQTNPNPDAPSTQPR